VQRELCCWNGREPQGFERRWCDYQRLDKDLLYIAPMKFTLSVLRCGLTGFPSVSETCTLPKFWVSPTLAPAIYRLYQRASDRYHRTHPDKAYTYHDINTSKPRNCELEQSDLIFPTRHVASSPTGLSVIGWQPVYRVHDLLSTRFEDIPDHDIRPAREGKKRGFQNATRMKREVEKYGPPLRKRPRRVSSRSSGTTY